MITNKFSQQHKVLSGDTTLTMPIRYRHLAAASALQQDFELAKAAMWGSENLHEMLETETLLHSYHVAGTPLWEDGSGRYSAYPGNIQTAFEDKGSLLSAAMFLCQRGTLQEGEFLLHQTAINILEGNFGHAIQHMVTFQNIDKEFDMDEFLAGR